MDMPQAEEGARADDAVVSEAVARPTQVQAEAAGGNDAVLAEATAPPDAAGSPGVAEATKPETHVDAAASKPDKPEEEENLDEYEEDGFVVNKATSSEEEGSSSDSEDSEATSESDDDGAEHGRRKRLKRGRQNLDEDDLDLIAENKAAAQARTNRMIVSDTSSSDEEEEAGKPVPAAAALKQKTDGDDDEEGGGVVDDEDDDDDDDKAMGGALGSDESSGVEDSDDMGDFIEDDDLPEGPEGEKERRRRRRKRREERRARGLESSLAINVAHVPPEQKDQYERLFGYDADEFALSDGDEEMADDEAAGGAQQPGREGDEEEDIDEVEARKRVAEARKRRDEFLASYEPDVIASMYMTEEAQRVRAQDVPERVQLVPLVVDLDSATEATMQVEWIYNTLSETGAFSIEVIENALVLFQGAMRFEPPAAHLYHAHKLQSASLTALWRIYDESCKFQSYFARLKLLRDRMMQLVPDDVADDVARPEGFWDQYDVLPFFIPAGVTFAVARSKREAWLRELGIQYASLTEDYVQDWIRTCEALDGAVQRVDDDELVAVRAIASAVCNVSHLAASLSKQSLVGPAPSESVDETPFQLSVRFPLARPSREEAVRAAVMRVAKQLASEPRVRDWLLKRARREATMSTTLTSKGVAVVADDTEHVYYGVSGLYHKPVSLYYAQLDAAGPDFSLVEELVLLRAASSEREGLLAIGFNSLHLASELLVSLGAFALASSELVTRLETELDASGELSEDFLEGVVQAASSQSPWDKCRLQALRQAVLRALAPWVENRLKEELFRRADEALAERCAQSLLRRVFVQPLALPVSRDPEVADVLARVKDTSELAEHPIAREVAAAQARVMGLHLTGERDAIGYAVVVDGQGRVLDKAALPPTYKREALWTSLRAFIEASRPHAVLVNASMGMRSRLFLKDLKQHADAEWQRAWARVLRKRRKAKRNQTVELDEWTGWFYACIVNDEIAQAFSETPAGAGDDPAMHANCVRALNLARYVQCPLAQVAGLFAHRRLARLDAAPVLALSLHPLQSKIAADVLVPALERSVVNAVCATGVDLADAVAYPHLAPLLPMVCGLGFVKAAALVQGLNAQPVVSRAGLRASKLLGNAVFANCVGFLRFRATASTDVDDEEERGVVGAGAGAHFLDATRVHPDDVALVADMLRALAASKGGAGGVGDEEDDEDDDDDDDDNGDAEVADEGMLPKRLERRLRGMVRASELALAAELDARPEFVSRRTEELYRLFVDHASLLVGEQFLDTFVLQDRLPSPREIVDRLPGSTHMLADERHACQVRLQLIVDEVRFPFADRRREFAPPSSTELFELLSEGLSASVGSLVHFTVERTDKYVDGRTESGVFVSVQRVPEEVVDDDAAQHELAMLIRAKEGAQADDERADAEQRLAEAFGKLGLSRGRPVVGKVVDVDMEAFKMRVTLRRSAVSSAQQRAQLLGDYFRPPASGRVAVRIVEKFRSRPIINEHFQNISYEDCVAMLTQPDKEIGAYVFRPHGHATDALTLSWLCSKNPPTVKHEQVDERTAKFDHKPAGDLSLGASLFLNFTRYEDLDEIAVMYVSRQAELIKSVQRQPSYRHNMTHEEAQGFLLDCCKRQDGKLYYLITPHEDWKKNPKLLTTYVVHFRAFAASKVELGFKAVVTVEGIMFLNQKARSMTEVIQALKTNSGSVRDYLMNDMVRKPSRWGPEPSQQQQQHGYYASSSLSSSRRLQAVYQ